MPDPAALLDPPLPTYDGPPYTATMALAISMVNTGLRPDAAMHRAQAMQGQLLAMGYALTSVEIPAAVPA